jgi:hypothetical protein
VTPGALALALLAAIWTVQVDRKEDRGAPRQSVVEES